MFSHCAVMKVGQPNGWQWQPLNTESWGDERMVHTETINISSQYYQHSHTKHHLMHCDPKLVS